VSTKKQRWISLSLHVPSIADYFPFVKLRIALNPFGNKKRWSAMSDVLSLAAIPKPSNVPVEMALIGSVIRNNEIVDEIDGIVSARDFFHPECREIYALIADEIKKGNGIDHNLLSSRLTADEKRVVKTCIENAGTRDLAKEHAKAIAGLAARREMMAIAFDLLLESQNQNIKIEGIIETVEDRIDGLRDGNKDNDDAEHVAVVANRIMDKSNLIHEKGLPPGLRTGVKPLDEIALPMRKGNFIIIAGRPAHGKTALALNILEHVAKCGVPSAMFSYEMTNEEAVERIMAGLAKTSSEKIADGTIYDDQELVRNLEASIAKLRGIPLYIQSPDKLTASNLYLKCKRLVRKYGVKVIAIDYIQLMDGDDNRPEHERISRISKACKRVAKRLGIVVIGISQLNRDIEKRENKIPNLSDLRASGSLEQDADLIIFCFREECYVAMEEPTFGDKGYSEWKVKMDAVRGKAQLIIAKQRRGKIGKVNVHFDHTATRFH
jgi:replicative DNA helicase